MKISMRSDYGARALLYLAERFGEGPIQSAEIAAHMYPEACAPAPTVTAYAGKLKKSVPQAST